jgi:hypothetical protein
MDGEAPKPSRRHPDRTAAIERIAQDRGVHFGLAHHIYNSMPAARRRVLAERERVKRQRKEEPRDA